MKKCYRSETNVKLGGVCSGLSEMFNFDVTVIRIVFFALLFTPVPIVISYLAAWFILPKKGELDVNTTCTCGAVSSSATTANPTGTDSKEFLAG